MQRETKKTMVSIRFSILVYAFFFMLPHCLAYSLQGDAEKMVVMASDKEGTILSRKEQDPVNVVPANVEVVVQRKVIGGRKMKKMLNEEQKNRDEMASKVAYSSNADPTNGFHNAHKRSKKIDHEDHQVEVKMSSTFMVINADYHVPRSHPPKNN